MINWKMHLKDPDRILYFYSFLLLVSINIFIYFKYLIRTVFMSFSFFVTAVAIKKNIQFIFLNKELPVLWNKIVPIKQRICTYQRETVVLNGECFDCLPVVPCNF